MSQKRTRVLLVDDSVELTRLCTRLIDLNSDLENAGVLSSADGLADQVLATRADVVLLDLTMPGVPAFEAIAELVERVPECRIVAYSGYDDDETRQSALAAGARAFVSKRNEILEIIRVIREVAAAPSCA